MTLSERGSQLLSLADVCHREKWFELEIEFLQTVRKELQTPHNGIADSTKPHPEQYYSVTLRICNLLHQIKKDSEAEELARVSSNQANYFKSLYYESQFLKFIGMIYQNRASDKRWQHDKEEEERNKKLRKKLEAAKNS